MADELIDRLKAAIEVPGRACLWTKADEITFTPRVLPKVYGDGRLLIAFSTMNQRPAYWVIRGCSTWAIRTHSVHIEETDEILTDLEDEFGDGTCGHSGTSLFQERETRMQHCDCEECSDSFVATWPMVWGTDGCLWSRLMWPKGFQTEEGGYLLDRAFGAATTQPGGRTDER